MSRRHVWISLCIAVPGIVACVLGVGVFFWRIVTNGLEYHVALTAREHYTAVGRSYGDGFLAGFFLCFFLVLGVLALSHLVADRRRPRLVKGERQSGRTVRFPRGSDFRG